jgi:PAS domain S-box-containing protein
MNLDQHRRNFEDLRTEIIKLSKQKTSNSLEISAMYTDLLFEMDRYDNELSTLITLILERGFKDNGVIGDMRKAAHNLELFPEISQVNVLQLRRHEKDYIIRNEQQYINKFHNLDSIFISEIAQRTDIPLPRRNSIIEILNAYQVQFDKMVLFDQKIGIRTSTGQKQILDLKEQDLINSCNSILATANQSKEVIFKKMEVFYAIYFILIFLLSVSISILISKRITAPLSLLTAHIQKLISSNFSLKGKPVFKNAQYEIEVLYNEFHKMLIQLEVRDKQRSQAEQAFRLNEMKYRHLADMLPQSIFETDQLGNFTYVNKTWIETFGYSAKEVSEGLNLIEVIKSDTMNTVVEGKEFNFKEFIGVRKNSETFPALVYSNPRSVKNFIVGYTGIVIDNTERKNYIEALEREKRKAEVSDQLKSAFLSNMSHEIRTPMNSIIGFAELLSRDGINEKDHKEYLRYIRQSGDLLLHLIDDIIDFAKIEAGELTIRNQEFNLNGMMEDLFIRFKENLREKEKSNVSLELFNDIPAKEYNIYTDLYRLNQILTNLLSNAVKFTEQGNIEFGYTIHVPSKIVFFVKDTGIGIMKKDQKLIFERFRQVDGSLMRKYGGTGLGLAITRHLVELLKGKIVVKSEPGIGSTFIIEMPLIEGNNYTFEQVQITDLKVDTEWNERTILIAEDDNHNFAFLKAGLKATGARILRAHDGLEALTIIENQPEIDLVLMDMQMPILSGYDATFRIKKIRPQIPVIAQTAYALSGEREKTLKAGCDDYISKPLNINLLISKISHFLQKKNSTARVLN